MATEANRALSRPTTSASKANSLADLKTAWTSKFNKRANGGWWALSGFSLQMIAALERMLKSELIDKRPRGEIDIEAVSDAILTERKTYLVQIKRSLTKAALEAAFAEAYDIASLCSNALQDQLRFQIVTMNRETSSKLDAALASNALRERTAIDEALLQRTLAMFDAVAPIRVSADPAQALRIVLWNSGVENPSATMEAMLGAIFAAFDGKDRAGVKDALVRALDKARSDVRVARAHGGHLFLPGDLKIVSTESSGTLLVDASPRMPDLKMGRFLERTRLLDQTLKAATRWSAGLDVQVAAQLSKIPVFCIRGRSGDGKSVLLLQLVAALLERRAIATVTGLASFDDLKDWLRSRPKVQPGEPVEEVELAYIDDLPRRIDTVGLTELIEESFAFGSRPAALLTCAITEDLPKTPSIEFDFFNMPQPSAEDQQQFSAWLGSGAPHTLDPGQSLATMLAVLRRPSANEVPLADQIEQELSRRGLWTTARHVIAANMFGLPGAVLPNQAAALRSFTFEQSGITLRADQRDGGFELGHAEFLEPLYQRWLGATNFPKAWGHDLGLAIAAALQSGKPRLARMLLGRMVDVRTMRRRLAHLPNGGEQPAGDLLFAAFAAAQAAVDDATMAPVMRQWLVAHRATKGSLTHGFEARAAALLDRPEVALSNKAEIALQLANGRADPERAGARTRALAYLETVGDEPMVIDYYARLASRSDASSLARVQKWLTRHQRSLSAAPVLATAIRAGGPHVANYRVMGFRMVGAHPQDAMLSELVRTLAQDQIEPKYVGSIDRWLAHPHPPRRLSAIYAQLLKIRGARRYLLRASNWLEQNVQTPDSHDLLVRLIQMQSAHDLGPLVESWLNAHPQDTGRYSVIGALLTHSPFEDVGLRLALELLAIPARNEHTRYLAALASPVVKAMTAHDIYALAKTLPADLRKPLASLRGAG